MLSRRRLVICLCLAIAPAPAGAEVLGLSPADFQASWIDPLRYDSSFDPAAGFRVATQGTACVYAAVQLPDQADVESLVFTAVDNNAASDLTVSLMRAQNGGANGQAVISKATNGSSSSIRTFLGLPGSGADTIVDSATEFWWMLACYASTTSLEFHHVYIVYSGKPAGIDTESPTVIPGAAFRTSSSVGLDFHTVTGYQSGSGLDSNRCVVAPIYLPAGAHIQALEADLWDQSAGANLGLQLRRKRLATSEGSQLIAEIQTTGANFSVLHLSTSAISNGTVSPDYQYFLSTPSNCLDAGTDLRIYSVRVVHDDPIFIDGFESGNFNPWTSPTAFLVIPPAAFIPAPWDFADDAVDLSSGILDLDENCVVAPVTLPHDAEISAMTTYLRDGDGSRNLTMRLRRKRGTTSAVTELASTTTSGSSSVQQTDAVFLQEFVDNDSYHYYVDACLPGGASAGSFAIHGVKLSYTRP